MLKQANHVLCWVVMLKSFAEAPPKTFHPLIGLFCGNGL